MKYDGKRSSVVVRTISYTGWKLIGIIPNKSLYQGTVGNIWMILLFLTLTIMTALLINRFASIYISTPILKLNESVKRYETGSKTEVYIGGPPEIRHLGASIEKSYEDCGWDLISSTNEYGENMYPTFADVRWMHCRARLIRTSSTTLWIPSPG